ncbi:ABC transporter permease [Paenibacillus endoradicis]|uniref:ABC transporter permease n=1 Tax=Paenibacillus endoradicis TaxID=2972487 RepID=UPI002158EFFD|nr:ABC transporter permease [Paenibacillus endoradicis]MCR8659913.1 ABC transporter permease [Paenibacillus endoradicis]
MKITNLAFANIKHNKSATTSLFILIFLASMLLNLGITIITQMNTFYDDKVTKLRDAHAAVVIDQANYDQSYEQYFSSYDGVSEIAVEQTLIMNSALFQYAGSDMSHGLAFLNAKTEREIAPLAIIEQLDTVQNNDIYLPYIFNTSGGYQLGNTISINYRDNTYTYRIAAFFEATMLGSNNMGLMKVYLPDNTYNMLSQQLEVKELAVLLSVRLEDQSQASTLLADFKRSFPQLQAGEFNGYYWDNEINIVKTSSSMTINIIAMILVAFATIIVLVSLIVIKFRVSTSIEDDMVNIGILQALGYTNNQIIASIMIQFLSITCIASILGVSSSYLINPLLGEVISSLTGLVWHASFNGLINICSVVLITLLVLIVILISTNRIRKLTVVSSLRGGIHTHNFRKNYIPLDKMNGSIHLLLASKTLLANIKQNIMLVIIVTAITFASVFSIVLYYNIAKEKQTFIHMVGSETSNVIVVSNRNETELAQKIEQIEGIEKVTVLDIILTDIDNQSFYTQISNDYSKLNNNTVYKGRAPQYDNEIAISWSVSQLLKKDIGDTVTVSVGQQSHSYLITGLSQSINFMGEFAAITLEGITNHISEYEPSTFHIYSDGVDNSEIITAIQESYGDTLEDIINVDETIDSQTGMYSSAVFFIMLIILVTTMLVVILILYLVIKTIITKRKKEFGILKGIGYTTLQLMNQIAWSFVPVVIIGVVIGGVLGSFYTNKLLALLLSSVGIRSVNFVVNYPVIIVFCVMITLLAYVVSMLIARKIKHISAYELITE